MFCNKCGAELPEESVFCNRCGAKLEAPEAQEATGGSAPLPGEEGFIDPDAQPSDSIAMREAYLVAQRATTHYGRCKDELVRIIDRDKYGRRLIEVSFTAFGPIGVPGTYIYYVVIQGVNEHGLAIAGPRAAVRVVRREFTKARDEVLFNNNWDLPLK